jgi:hypothetical protein
MALGSSRNSISTLMTCFPKALAGRYWEHDNETHPNGRAVVFHGFGYTG